MEKKLSIYQTILFMVLAAAVTFVITCYGVYYYFNSQLVDIQTKQQQFSKLTEIMNIVDKNFVGEYTQSDLTDGAAAGIVAALGDKWSYYLTKDEYKSYKEDVSGQYAGLGITVNYDADRGGLTVLEVYDNSPAQKVDIRPLDLITAIDGVPITELGFYGAVKKVHGKPDTSVKIAILRGTNEVLEKTCVRAIIKTVNATGEMLEGNIGYIRIKEFTTGAENEFISAADALKKAGAKSFIFDVRNNPGGSLNTLLKMLDYILPEGVLFKEVDKAGTENEYTSNAAALNMPIAVLANENSISAAEYFAAVIQEYGKGTVVGEATTGKGYGQVAMDLSDGSAIVISTIKYYTPSGKSLAKTGIKPNYEVKMTADEKSMLSVLEHSKDPVIKKAIEILK